MDDGRRFRERRIGLAIAAVALVSIGHRERPTFGSISITIDGAHAPRVSAALAPPLDAAAALVTVGIEALTR